MCFLVDDIPLQSWVLVVAVLESKFPVHPQGRRVGWDGVQSSQGERCPTGMCLINE